MRLLELQPHFFVLKTDYGEDGERRYFHHIDDFNKATGMRFLCPKCFIENGGEIGTHQLIVWFANHGAPQGWNVVGTGYNDISFVPPGLTSIQAVGGCAVHIQITNGEVINA